MRPCDQRNFLHKKLLGIAGALLPGPLGVGARFIGSRFGGRRGRPVQPVLRAPPTSRFGGRRPLPAPAVQPAFQPVVLTTRAPTRPVLPRTLTARPGPDSSAGKQLGRILKFSPDPTPVAPAIAGSPCRTGESARCCQLRNGGFREQAQWQRECGVAGGNGVDPDEPDGFPAGDAINGRYGAAFAPRSMMIDRAVCDRGMQLADDGLCYNRSQITNKQRMWPAGRKPLLTGGDMRSIATAARAGRRLEGARKRLEKLGMMKKSSSRRRLPPHQHQIQVT